MTTDKLSAAYASMIDAAAGDTPFSDTMLKLAALNNAPGAVLFELNRRTGEISNFVSPQLEFGNDGYNKHLNSINPRMRYSMRHASGHITYEHRFTTEDAMSRHEFYDWLTQRQGLRYFLGARLFDRGDISLFHSVEFSKHDEHPNRELIEQFSSTSKRLANALRLNKHLTPDNPQWDIETWAPNHLPWAIFAFNSKGVVCGMNMAAQDVVDDCSVVEFGTEGIQPKNRSSRPAFQNMMKDALGGVTSAMLLASTPSRAKFIAQTIPVEHSRTSPSHPVSALLYLWNPLLLKRGDPDVLFRLWELSPAEAKVALLVARGETLSDISDMLLVTRNTTRNHLQRIFEKTGTSRQTELAILLFGILDLR